MQSVVLIASLLLSCSLCALAERVAMGFANECPFLLQVYWEKAPGEEYLVLREVSPQSHAWITTFKGHKFNVRNKAGELLNSHVSTGVDEVITTRPSANATDHCTLGDVDRTCIHRDPVTGKIHQDERVLQERRKRAEEDRLAYNKEWPSRVPHFTPLGFKKTRVPDDVWEMLLSYYNHNKEQIALEKWEGESEFVNHWEASTYMIYLPETGALKQKVFNALRPVLSEWSGVKDLESQALYGIRIYTRNSRLENHSDRYDTHAVSAIIHIEHRTDEPWPLEIYDHEGKVHHFTMEPKDMILYESVASVHGRPTPLNGSYYSNCFAHFRPVDSALWPPKDPARLRKLRNDEL